LQAFPVFNSFKDAFPAKHRAVKIIQITNGIIAIFISLVPQLAISSAKQQVIMDNTPKTAKIEHRT
jgi:hypothetical protein